MDINRWVDSRHSWRSCYAPLSAFAFAFLQTQSDRRLGASGMTEFCCRPVRRPSHRSCA